MYYKFLHQLLFVVTFDNFISLYIDFYIEIINNNNNNNELINENLYLIDDLTEHIFQNSTSITSKYYNSTNGRMKLEYLKNISNYILKTMKKMNKVNMYKYIIFILYSDNSVKAMIIHISERINYNTNEIIPIYKSLMSEYSKSNNNNEISVIYGEIINCYIKLSDNNNNTDITTIHDDVIKYLLDNYDSYPTLKYVNDFLSQIPDDLKVMKEKTYFKLLDKFSINLSSNIHRVRLLSLQILNNYPKLKYLESKENEEFIGECDIISHLLEIESLQVYLYILLILCIEYN